MFLCRLLGPCCIQAELDHVRRNVMRSLARKIAGWFSLTSERGVTAIEYGLIASLIAVAIIGAITLIGTNLTAVFTKVSSNLK